MQYGDIDAEGHLRVTPLADAAAEAAFAPPDGSIAYRQDINQFRMRRNGVWIGQSPSPLLFGASDLSTTNQPRWLYPGYAQALAIAGGGGIEMLAPSTGFLRNLSVRANNGGAGGGTLTYTVRLDGVDTALTLTMPVNGQSASDLVNKIAVTQGQRIGVRVTKAGAIVSSPMNIVAAVEFSA